MLTPSSLCVFTTIIFFCVCVCKCVCIRVSCPKARLSSGVWHHTANTAVYDRGDDEICFALSVCTGLPASFFFQPKLASVEGGIVLAKM